MREHLPFHISQFVQLSESFWYGVKQSSVEEKQVE